MGKLAIVVLLGMLSCIPSFSRSRLQGYCEKGGVTVSTGSQISTTKVQASYPSCTVTIYRSGTLTLASIFSDNSGTVLANPFTAAADGAWFFYASNGRYDVAFSDGGISPPFTRGDLSAFDENSHWFNVNSCLAQGDGVTDDSSAINSCIDLAAAVTGGATVFFPPGVYGIASPIVLKSNVTLLGAEATPKYGALGSNAVTIKTITGFPTDGRVIDARSIVNTGIRNLTILGDSVTQTQTQTDATSIGIAYGSSDLPTVNCYARHILQNVSIEMNKVGIKNACADYFWGDSINVASNWYIGIWGYAYGFNDSTFTKVYINSNNWLLPGVDPNTDLYTGTGLYLGWGCASQRWIGGKIEFNGTGVLIESGSDLITEPTGGDVNFSIQISGFMLDHNTKWGVHVRNNAPSTNGISDILISDNTFDGSGWLLDSTHSAHIFLDGNGVTSTSLFLSIIGNTFNYAPTNSASAYAGTPVFPIYASILANHGGNLKVGIQSNKLKDAARTNQILISSSVNTESIVEEGANQGNFSWNIPATLNIFGRSVRQVIGGNQTPAPLPAGNPGLTANVIPTLDVQDITGNPTHLMLRASTNQGTDDLFNCQNTVFVPTCRVTFNGIGWFAGLNMFSDGGTFAAIGRYSSLIPTAILDFTDPKGTGLNPTSASLRVNSTEVINLNTTATNLQGLQIRGGGIIQKYLTGVADWTPGTIPSLTVGSTTVTVPGAAIGDTAVVSINTPYAPGILLAAAVSGVDTVTVSLFNGTASTSNIGAVQIRLDIWQH